MTTAMARFDAASEVAPAPLDATATWTELPGAAAPMPGDPCLLVTVDVMEIG